MLRDSDSVRNQDSAVSNTLAYIRSQNRWSFVKVIERSHISKFRLGPFWLSFVEVRFAFGLPRWISGQTMWFYSALTTKWRGGAGGYVFRPLFFNCLELFNWLLEICSRCLGNYWEIPICCSNIDISKKHFFYPTITYSGLCSLHDPCMQILFLIEFLNLGVIYLEKSFEVHRSPPKII